MKFVSKTPKNSTQVGGRHFKTVLSSQAVFYMTSFFLTSFGLVTQSSSGGGRVVGVVRGGGRLRDDPKERLRGRLEIHGKEKNLQMTLHPSQGQQNVIFPSDCPLL